MTPSSSKYQVQLSESFTGEWRMHKGIPSSIEKKKKKKKNNPAKVGKEYLPFIVESILELTAVDTAEP